MWFLVAARIGMPVWRAKEELPYTEFIRWCEFVRRERWDYHDRKDWQLALLTFWVYRLNFILGGKPDATVKDFLLEFTEAQGAPKKVLSPEEAEAARLESLELQKAFFTALAGREPS